MCEMTTVLKVLPSFYHATNANERVRLGGEDPTNGPTAGPPTRWCLAFRTLRYINDIIVRVRTPDGSEFMYLRHQHSAHPCPARAPSTHFQKFSACSTRRTLRRRTASTRYCRRRRWRWPRLSGHAECAFLFFWCLCFLGNVFEISDFFFCMPACSGCTYVHIYRVFNKQKNLDDREAKQLMHVGVEFCTLRGSSMPG